MSQTIALVDDDRNLLTSISIALEREGFKVQTYIDGESAFNQDKKKNVHTNYFFNIER